MSNICISEFPEKKEYRAERAFEEIKGETFPNVAGTHIHTYVYKINLQIQEDEQTPKQDNSKEFMPKRSRIKFLNTEDEGKS